LVWELVKLFLFSEGVWLLELTNKIASLRKIEMSKNRRINE